MLPLLLANVKIAKKCLCLYKNYLHYGKNEKKLPLLLRKNEKNDVKNYLCYYKR